MAFIDVVVRHLMIFNHMISPDIQLVEQVQGVQEYEREPLHILSAPQSRHAQPQDRREASSFVSHQDAWCGGPQCG